jgi:hypothetical protein
MIESILKKLNTDSPVYEPVGVWVVDDDKVEMFYKKTAGERRERADALIERLKSADIKKLPSDFLEYHRDQRSPYDAVFSEIVETDKYSTMTECGKAILADLK